MPNREHIQEFEDLANPAHRRCLGRSAQGGLGAAGIRSSSGCAGRYAKIGISESNYQG